MARVSALKNKRFSAMEMKQPYEETYKGLYEKSPYEALPYAESYKESMAGATASRPIDYAEFEGLIAPFRDKAHNHSFAVAVSGGADSLALLFLLARAGLAHTALSVDHHMRRGAGRPAALAEIDRVAQVAHSLNIPHHVLREESASAPHNQEEARLLRYRLLADFCQRHQITYCALAHHLNDQAEVFLWRLARGSGVRGLAAMASDYVYRSCHFIRPLLSIAPERLRANLRQANIAWCEDPSNHNPAYSRTHLRRALPILAKHHIAIKDLTDASAKARLLRERLDRHRDDFFASAVQWSQGGYCWLDMDAFYALPEIFAHHILAEMITIISGAVFAPRSAAIARLYHKLHKEKAATLGGCHMIRVQPKSGDGIGRNQTLYVFFRERARVAPPLPLTRNHMIWDRRFHVYCDFAPTSSRLDSERLNISVGAVGAAAIADATDAVGTAGTAGVADFAQWIGARGIGARGIGKRGIGERVLQKNRQTGMPLPIPVAFVLPAFFQNGELFAIPYLDFWRDPKWRKLNIKIKFLHP